MPAFGSVGFIGRFKPLHNGAALVLERLCEAADHVVIGIGSSNKYNLRNPFTPEETKAMIDAYLRPRFTNYETLFVPDFGHLPEGRDGRLWKSYVIEYFGNLDVFVTGNSYVAELLKDHYAILHSAALIPREEQFRLRASAVRHAMALGADWKSYVPKEVAAYLESHGLIERFRNEFGLDMLAESAEHDWWADEPLHAEQRYTHEV